ncbi:MAG TPA: hypothetical protein VFC79_02100 [Tissierellaceae bacterium]|nr:hypothetical protein [Tissierellaceae bacterium]
MQLKVIKYRLYPDENPIGYAVGFNIKLINGRSFYAHTIVDLDDLEEGKTDEEITQIAYGQLEEHIADRVGELTYIPMIEGIEINIDGEYEAKAIDIDARVVNLESTVDVLLGGDNIE